MIHHTHRFIFVHIPKCAGTSIEAAFEDGAGPDLRWRALAEALAAHPDYLAFGFIRDPVARFVSIWRHSERNLNQLPFFRRGPLTLESYLQRVAEVRRAFRAGTPYTVLSSHRGVLGLSQFDVFHTAAAQADYIPAGQASYLNTGVSVPRARRLFVGQVCRMQHDWPRLLEVLGLPLIPLPNDTQGSSTPSEILTVPEPIRRLICQAYSEDEHHPIMADAL